MHNNTSTQPHIIVWFQELDMPRKAWIVGGLILFFLLFISIMLVEHTPPSVTENAPPETPQPAKEEIVEPAPSVPNAVPVNSPSQTIAPPANQPTHTVEEQTMPMDEKEFISTVNSFQTRYGQVANEFQKSAVRRERAEAFARIIPSLSVNDWTGQVSSMETTSEGRGILSVKLLEGNPTKVETWNNSFPTSATIRSSRKDHLSMTKWLLSPLVTRLFLAGHSLMEIWTMCEREV